MPSSDTDQLIGLIANTTETLRTANNIYTESRDAEGFPQAFREVGNAFPLVLDTLVAVQDILAHSTDTIPLEAMRLTVEGCEDRASRLLGIFRRVLPPAETPSLDRYYDVMRSMGRGNQVEVLMKGILDYVQVLRKNRAIEAATTVYGGRLARAIQELSATPASVPDQFFDSSSSTFIHHGLGSQNINSGFGTQNNNTGNASNLYIATRDIHFGSRD